MKDAYRHDMPHCQKAGFQTNDRVIYHVIFVERVHYMTVI